MIAPLAPNEAERLEALRACGILDTPYEPEYDDLARLAASTCGVPVALVSLVDECRQWFKARVGLDAAETHRDLAFCAHAILHDDLYVVPDAAADPKFKDNPLVTGPPHIRFYAGMPLTVPEGYNLGTLCVIDVVPRQLTLLQRDALRVLARQVVAQFLLRRQVKELEAETAERRRAETALRASEQKFRNTVDRLAEGVLVADVASTAIVEANAALLGMLGYTAPEFLGLTLFDIMAGETVELFDRNARERDERLARTGRCDIGRRQFRRKDGSVVPVDLRVTAVPDEGAGLHAYIVRDVTEELEYENRLLEYQAELEGANAKLKSLAHTDGLTGVKNRAAFNEKLGEEFDRAGRYGHPLSVMLMDVDHFKLFNDTFGHPAGDAVLQGVAGTLQAAVRTTDVVARYGGEEFVIILPDTDRAGAMVLAERCRRAVAGHPWDRRAITVSIGVATLTPDVADAAALVQQADEALYRSKQAGRNRVTHGAGSASTWRQAAANR